MTQLLTASIGNYPRIGEDKDQQRHRRALAHLQNREISAHAFLDVEQSVMREIIREQILSGLDEITDGLIGWSDPITHLCKNIRGISITGLRRYFDTNIYYRVPIISSRPKIKGSVTVSEFRYAKTISHRPLRTILTGPYTLARHTLTTLKTYEKIQTRLDFFTDVIRIEIAALIKEGVTLIQIDEPSLAQNSDDAPLVLPALQKILEAAESARVILALYYSPLTRIYNAVREFPLYSLNLDFTQDTESLFESVSKNPPASTLGFGIIDSRTTRPDATEHLKEKIESWIDRVSPARVYLTPSAGLESLPRPAAQAKLAALGHIRKLIQSRAVRS